MVRPDEVQPYIPVQPGGLITAEDINEIQQMIRAEVATNAQSDDKNRQDLTAMITAVDAPKFGGKTPTDWTDDLDKRYIRRDDPQAAGQYRRYFKHLDEIVVRDGRQVINPALIEHNLCRYPIVEVYELIPLFQSVDGPTATKLGLPDNYQKFEFLVYYANRRDPVADYLNTESNKVIWWGDPIEIVLDQFGLKWPASQAFDDVLNDLWGKMFDPGDEQDQFDPDSYGNSPYTQEWIDRRNVTVGDLQSGGQWKDIRVAVRPRMLSSGLQPSTTATEGSSTGLPGVGDEVDVYHLSLNAIEIHVPRTMDLMVVLRT